MTPFDVQLEDGDLPKRTTHIRGPDQIAQRLQIRLNTWRGEWFADTRRGLPWMEWKQSKPPDTDAIEAQLRAQIRRTPGVLRVSDLSVDFSDGQVSASGTIQIEDQERVLEAEIYGPGGNSQPVMVTIL